MRTIERKFGERRENGMEIVEHLGQPHQVFPNSGKCCPIPYWKNFRKFKPEPDLVDWKATPATIFHFDMATKTLCSVKQLFLTLAKMRILFNLPLTESSVQVLVRGCYQRTLWIVSCCGGGGQ